MIAIAGKFFAVLAVFVLASPAYALDPRPAPAQPLGKVILGTGTSGDGSMITAKPATGGLPSTLMDMLGRTANPLDFKTQANTDADTIKALYAKWPRTHLVTISDANRNFNTSTIPQNAEDHVFLWPEAPPTIRPTFPGLHVLPIGSRLEIFRGKTRANDYADLYLTRDTRDASGTGVFGNNNAQIRIDNYAINATTFEWPLIVTQIIDGNGTGEHAGITAYTTRKGPGGGGWNFVGGFQDWLANPTKGGIGAELGYSARGPDQGGNRVILDLPTSSFRFQGGEKNSFGTVVAATADPQGLTGDITYGVRLGAAHGLNGSRGDARVKYPMLVNNLWGVDQGAYGTQALEAVQPGLNSRVIHALFESFPNNNQTRSFGIRERRSGAVIPGSEKQSISIDLFRQENGADETLLSLAPEGQVTAKSFYADGDISSGFGGFRQSVRTGIAASGTTSEGAFQLDTGVSVVQSGSGGVRLRVKLGERQEVFNRSGKDIRVYPPPGMNIENGTANVPISLLNGGHVAVTCVNATWCLSAP